MPRVNNLIAFLDSEPPQDSKRLRELFVAREAALERTIERLKAVRYQDPKRVLAITGLARVGKSHLLNRAILDIRRSFKAMVTMRITPGHGGGRSVLREMLSQVTAQLHKITLEKGIATGDQQSVLEPLLETIRIFSEAISGHATEIQVQEITTTAHNLKRQIGSSFKTSALIALFGGPEIGLSMRRETGDQESRTETRQVKVNAFEEEALCELIGLGHDLIRSVEPRWQTLLIIDDFDILHRSETGSFDPVPLMQQLYNLAQVEGLHVVTTVREDTYHQFQKVFYRITQVKAFERDDHLIEAYRRRVEQYHRASEPHWGEELVADVAQRTEGRIGVFFEWLKELYDDGALDLKEWFIDQWAAALNAEAEAASIIAEAALAGNLTAEQAAAIRKTALQRFTLEDYSSFDNMRVDPVIRSLLLELVRRAENGESDS